jgi:hypothetical protein
MMNDAMAMVRGGTKLSSIESINSVPAKFYFTKSSPPSLADTSTFID